jgi:CRP-like cAMP-binding protein
LQLSIFVIPMKQLIRSYFDSQAILNDEDWHLFQSGLQERRFRKGSLILQEGEVENYLSFIVSGSVRLYTITPNGEDVSVGFAAANCFAGSYSSFISQKPSLLNVEALEDLFLLSISFENLNKCYSVSATGEILGRINAEMHLIHQEERQISLLTKSATERYLELLEQNPHLLQLVKLQHIASYLGIKPESLSRIRKSMNVAIN